jgi:hypothetical protein
MTPFDHAKETWVQRVIADGMASCSRFFEFGQDSLGRCALEDSPSCYGAVALTAENISILIELLRQRDGWTATLTTLVTHGAASRIVATHKWITTLKKDRSLSILYPCAPRGKSRGNTRKSRQENLPVTGLADPRHILKLA